jgi:hypothetical protein
MRSAQGPADTRLLHGASSCNRNTLRDGIGSGDGNLNLL